MTTYLENLKSREFEEGPGSDAHPRTFGNFGTC